MNDAPTTGQARILIVDDHPIVRRGLAQLIDHEPDLHVAYEAENAQEAFEILESAEDNLPEIAVVDISLPGMTGIDLIKHLRTRYPSVRILALSMLDENLYAERALRSGANGYIMKQEATERVITALRRVLRGEVYLSDEMSSKMIQQLVSARAEGGATSLSRLSDREIEVFRRIGQGRSTRQIAEALHLSVKTIETYRENIKHKLKLKNASELVQHAVQWVQMEEGAVPH